MVTLESGTYSVEWYRVNSRETVNGDDVEVAGGRAKGTSFVAPFEQESPAVLYLKRVYP